MGHTAHTFRGHPPRAWPAQESKDCFHDALGPSPKIVALEPALDGGKRVQISVVDGNQGSLHLCEY